MVQEAKSVTAAVMARAGLRPSSEPALPVRADHRGSVAETVGRPTAAVTRQFAAYAQLQAVKDGQQNIALADRQRLAEAETIRNLAREIRANLMAIIKNYPPFPPDSEERQRYLELAVGLRKQMEALIVPPPERGGPPAFAADGRAALAGLSLEASDADVAAAAHRLAKLESEVAGYGEEIRTSWRSEPMGQDAARQLSAAAAGQLEAFSSGSAAPRG